MLPITNIKELGETYRRERRALGKTQAQVAKDAGVRRETVIRIEAGENVDAMTFLKAIAALGKGISIVDMRPSYDDIKEQFNEN